MYKASVVPLLLFFAVMPSASAEFEKPLMQGYVTSIKSAYDFEVNNIKVICSKDTISGVQRKDLHQKLFTTVNKQCDDRYVGQAIDVYGKYNKKHVIAATQIDATLSLGTVEGFGVIDRVISSSTVKGTTIVQVRADGYQILITPQTKTRFDAPLTSIGGIATNIWVDYAGEQREDGVIVAKKIHLKPNKITEGEARLQDDWEYDPTVVAESDRQGAASKFLRGTIIKRIPAYDDPKMQSRVQAIGTRLIPTYQRALSNTDFTKIDFLFQVVDQPGWSDARTLPNGIIIIPRQVVERMQNDDQLATVLADNIAIALEKQSYRYLPVQRSMNATQVAGLAAGLFVPGLGLATLGGNYVAGSQIMTRLMQQSGRVSLGLLSDAGFDLEQAPAAWWVLASKEPTNLDATKLPDRSIYLYKMLGANWRKPATPESTASKQP